MPAAEPPLGGPVIFVGLAIAGTLLAMLCIYAGTGLLDGFRDWDLHRIGRRLRGALPWALPLAGLGGLLLHAYYRRLLAPGTSGWVVLLAIPRAFAHFMLFGALALVATLLGFALAFGRALLRRWQRLPCAEAEESLPLRWLGVPVWFVVLPFVAMKLPLKGDMELPATISRRRLLRWLPAVLAMTLLWVGAEGEDSGKRVDPYAMAALASFWLADYLIVMQRIAPILRARSR